MVDLKVFPAFLRYVPFQSPTLQRHIVCMIVNRLYAAPDAVLNKEALEGPCIPASMERRVAGGAERRRGWGGGRCSQPQ